MKSPNRMPRNAAGFLLLTSRGAGATTVSSDGASRVTIDILVLLPLNTARCSTLLYLPLLTICSHTEITAN